MADVSAAKPVTAEVMRSTAAARVISPTASESPAAAPAKSPAAAPASAKSPECVCFGSGREREAEDRNGNSGGRSAANQMNQ